MTSKHETGPEEGDIVMATVTKIAPHAAFVDLDNYEGVRGLIHISEISKNWVKNIKSHVREGQSIVCKVLQIKSDDNFMHLSVRRVSDYDKRAKWDQIRRRKRVKNLLGLVAERSGKDIKEIYEILKPLEKKYGEIYFVFEEAKKKGKNFFKDLPEISDVLWKVVDKNISLPEVEIVGSLRLKSRAGDGLEKVKSMLSGLDADVKYISAPKYRLTVKAGDYKKAEKKLDKVLSIIEKRAGKTESFSFDREKK